MRTIAVPQSVRHRLRHTAHLAGRVRMLPRLISDLTGAGGRAHGVVYLVEGANWSIREDGLNITERLRKTGMDVAVDSHPSYYANRILHFGSANVFHQFGREVLGGRNKIVVTFFHGKFGDSPELDQRLTFALRHIGSIDVLVVSNQAMRRRFIEWGVPEEKLTLIPIGVDTDRFTPAGDLDRERQRNECGFDPDAFVVGSFQKDGSGWGEGLEPKRIKGPDLFVKAMIELAKRRKVACMLAGPSRGYVKHRLEEAGIFYKHIYFDNADEVAGLFSVLDAYLVSSREEGGPKAILEAMATGTPLVTTNVGMAGDLVRHGKNALLVDVEDVDAMTDMLDLVASNSQLAHDICKQGRIDVAAYDWDHIANACGDLYRRLMG